MLNEQTVSILNQLKLFGMAESFSNKLSRTDLADLSHAEFVGLLVEDEKTYRENKRLTRLLKNAHLKEPACLEDVDYRHPRGLQKQMMTELSKGDWLTHHQNILITGPTGIGKTWLSSALGNQACRLGFSTETLRFPRLVEILYASRADGSHLKQLSRFAKVMVLIVDDRHGIGSTILTSQLPTSKWHEVIGEPTLADAICDRLFAKAHRIELKGKSLR